VIVCGLKQFLLVFVILEAPGSRNFPFQHDCRLGADLERGSFKVRETGTGDHAR